MFAPTIALDVNVAPESVSIASMLSLPTYNLLIFSSSNTFEPMPLVSCCCKAFDDNGYYDRPVIFDFIDKANKAGAKLEYTLNDKELLKAIYRSVF